MPQLFCLQYLEWCGLQPHGTTSVGNGSVWTGNFEPQTNSAIIRFELDMYCMPLVCRDVDKTRQGKLSQTFSDCINLSSVLWDQQPLAYIPRLVVIVGGWMLSGRNFRRDFELITNRGGLVWRWPMAFALLTWKWIYASSSSSACLAAYRHHGHVRKYDFTKVKTYGEMDQSTSSMIFSSVRCTAMTKQQHHSTCASSSEHTNTLVVC